MLFRRGNSHSPDPIIYNLTNSSVPTTFGVHTYKDSRTRSNTDKEGGSMVLTNLKRSVTGFNHTKDARTIVDNTDNRPSGETILKAPNAVGSITENNYTKSSVDNDYSGVSHLPDN